MNHQDNEKVDARLLTGVSETALATLYGRAYQAAHPDPIIDDPMAIKLVDSIEFDFEKFGRKGQEMALRSLAVDQCAIAYLTTHPKATVVALAEGFQTSFWRLDHALPDAQFTWVSVDLPPVVELRRRLLPHSPRITHLAQSALDYTWIDEVDASNGVFITAEGLLMYLQPDEALGLIAQCARRFPGGRMFFDLPPTDRQEGRTKGAAFVQALPGAANAVQPLGASTGEVGANHVRCPRRARCADARGTRRVLRDAVPRVLAVPTDEALPRGLRPTRIRLRINRP